MCADQHNSLPKSLLLDQSIVLSSPPGPEVSCNVLKAHELPNLKNVCGKLPASSDQEDCLQAVKILHHSPECRSRTPSLDFDCWQIEHRNPHLRSECPQH